MNNHAVVISQLDASERYRDALIEAFGEAVPAQRDAFGVCELCQESVKCPGWHAPEEVEE